MQRPQFGFLFWRHPVQQSLAGHFFTQRHTRSKHVIFVTLVAPSDELLLPNIGEAEKFDKSPQVQLVNNFLKIPESHQIMVTHCSESPTIGAIHVNFWSQSAPSVRVLQLHESELRKM